MINGKRLITSFFLANLVDTAITLIFLSQEGWRELNALALGKISQGQFDELIILMIAFTAVLIGSYALAKNVNSRWEYPLEQAVRLGSLIVWSVQVWNAFNIVAALSQTA